MVGALLYLENNMELLDNAQLDAVNRIKNGCIVCGGVGSGKSRVGLLYFFRKNGGELRPFREMKISQRLIIITTAKKRDSKEWESELAHFLLDKEKNDILIDSWNNIKKYQDETGSFFIFDEDRVTGSGAWVRAFLKISKSNEWIILSATPGDCYNDYGPVFVANGFYKNITEFRRNHVVYNSFTHYRKIDRYINTVRLDRLKNKILVDIHYQKHTISHHIPVYTDYDMELYKKTQKNRWNYAENCPIETANELCVELRRICNCDISRADAVLNIIQEKHRVIIFYNFDCELEMLEELCMINDIEFAEWNGHRHNDIPDGNKWVYLVQYNACEGWNCTKTDTIIFYSQTYSYKTLVQAAGRIDRRNTLFTDLYFYHLRSKSQIDFAIARALKSKKKFNESKFANFSSSQKIHVAL